MPSAGYQQQTNNDMDCIIEPVLGVGGLWLGNYSAATNIDSLMRTNFAYSRVWHSVHRYFRYGSKLHAPKRFSALPHQVSCPRL
jgi:hypothetical protein